MNREKIVVGGRSPELRAAQQEANLEAGSKRILDTISKWKGMREEFSEKYGELGKSGMAYAEMDSRREGYTHIGNTEVKNEEILESFGAAIVRSVIAVAPEEREEWLGSYFKELIELKQNLKS